jgi:hypothetical protein
MIGSGQIIIIIIIMVEKTIIIIIIIIMIIHYQKDWGLSSNHLPTCPAGIPMNQPVSGNDILGQMTQAP